MAKRYIGDAVVTLEYDGFDSYKGSVQAYGKTWRFSELQTQYSRAGGSHAKTPNAYDRAAEDAVGFGSYYTTGNRYDVGKGYPSAAVSDAIGEATVFAQDDRGVYEVRRTKHGRTIKVRNNPARRRRRR